MSVTDLSRMITRALTDNLPTDIRVIGEISGLSARNHWYFQLKDEGAVISCVMFASSAARVRFRPENGHEIIAKGRIEHYAKQGRTQLYVSSMQPVGAGALELQFRALCDELRKLGWFSEERKRPIPAYPRRIAIITSATSAALQDVLDTLRRRSPFVEVLVIDVRVQGEDAAPSVVRAIRMLNRRKAELGVDTLIITRGGGSMEDLWAFNERPVAEAIIASDLPVICAIGHETDTTIAELCADLRAATPTQAAMRAAPDRQSMIEQLDHIDSRLRAALRRRAALDAQRVSAAARFWLFSQPTLLIERKRDRVESLRRALHAAMRSRRHEALNRLNKAAVRLARVRPDAVSNARRLALAECESRLRHAMRDRLRRVDLAAKEHALTQAWRHRLQSRRDTVNALDRSLRIAGPHSVLKRGFSVTFNAKGRVITKAAGVATGDLLTTRLVDGDILSIVARDDAAEQPRPAPTRRRKPADADPDAPSLFETD